MNEHRESPRNLLQKRVPVINLASDETVGEVVNINPKGMLISSVVAIQEEHSMELRLLLPDKIFGRDYLEVSAKCVWTKPENNATGNQCGFEFTDVAPQDIGIILGVIMEYGLSPE